MHELIGEKLEVALEKLKLLGLKYEIIDNNFSIVGDQKLVTNVFAEDDTVKLITGDFIFDIRNKKNEE